MSLLGDPGRRQSIERLDEKIVAHREELSNIVDFVLDDYPTRPEKACCFEIIDVQNKLE